MVRLTVPFLLAISVFSCPMICGTGGAQPGSSHQGSCSCCHESTLGEHPSPDHGSRQCCCQGICGGAVLEAGVQINLHELLASTGVDDLLPASALIETHSIDLVSETAFAAAAPPDGENLGRALRHLLSSLLC